MAEPAPKRLKVACGRCGRTTALTPQSVARRGGACAYCGEPLPVPQELMDGAAAAGPRTMLAIECPVCAKVTRARGAVPGGLGRCFYCGCPWQVPEADGLAVETPPEGAIPTLEPGAPLTAPCPQCGDFMLAAASPSGVEAACGGCGAAVDCAALPLEAFVDPESGEPADRMARAAREALRARWRWRNVGLAEASALVASIDAIEAWSRLPRAPFSPYAPEATVELVQWAVLCAASAMRSRAGGACRLIVPLSADTNAQLLKDLGGLALALGLAATTGHLLHAWAWKTEDDAPQGEPALVLAFAPEGGGTGLAIAQRDPEGREQAAKPEVARRVAAALRRALGPAARRFFCFKAVFGIWTSGAMFNAVHAGAAKRRLELLGNPLASESDAIARALTERQPLSAEELGR